MDKQTDEKTLKTSWLIICFSVGSHCALLSDRRFVTRMISLRVFLHFCVGYRHTNQELFIGKSSLERILKKSQKSIIQASLYMDNFASWSD